MQEFRGFGARSFGFMQGLKDNNDRAWFERHRADWETLKGELQSLCGAMAPFLEELDPDLETDPKTGRCLGRIFRDIRFTRDKSLFRESIDVLFFPAAYGRTKAPGFAVGLKAAECYIGTWLGASMTDWRARFEANIAAAPGLFESYLERNDNFGGLWLRSESYKKERVPGLPALARQWAQRKYFYLAEMVPAAEAVRLGTEIVGRIEERFLRLYPLYLFATSERVAQELERFGNKYGG
ncbi:MAG: DUF2461 family protein [Candidatus Glassbacteria bacterium]|nr:DUF2461 family protein [Candidatus Glassbacteria bacterium]